MQVFNKKREPLAGGGGSLPRNKRARLSVYDKPPTEEISLHEFEQFALDRMRVLKAIDSGKAKNLEFTEFKYVVDKACHQFLPLRDNSTDFEEDMRKDNISHYVLRIAYSRTEELRRWFLRQEELLFKHRFNALDVDGRNHAMKLLAGNGGSALSNIDEEFWLHHNSELQRVFGHAVVDDDGTMLRNSAKPWEHVYIVPFEQVLDLVSSRRVFLSEGNAYVVSRDIVSVVISNFRQRLSRNLTENARAFYAKAEEEADRLGPLLENLTNAYLGPSFAAGTAVGQLTLDKIPTVMARSAPLCMKNLYDELSGPKHHLKHDGRQQFGLFLKGIGVTLEDSLTLWKEEMMKGGKTAEQFDKGYAYNIRHNYGKEGKRTSYSPYSCMKIINMTPVGDQICGCPYRHWDASHLHSALSSMRLGPSVINNVLEKVKGQHYQVACLAVFEAMHGGATVESLNHPNQYFQESMKVHEDNALAAAEASGEKAPAAPTPAKKEGSAMETQPVA
mmetsp:Transcript_32706/g.67587  ORF Transcript_32706/g.67587 Transcript_32706/m.67587 type:complete len:503 (-) Transcript_32706:106-1614(-)